MRPGRPRVGPGDVSRHTRTQRNAEGLAPVGDSERARATMSRVLLGCLAVTLLVEVDGHVVSLLRRGEPVGRDEHRASVDTGVALLVTGLPVGGVQEAVHLAFDLERLPSVQDVALELLVGRILRGLDLGVGLAGGVGRTGAGNEQAAAEPGGQQ